MAAAWLARSPPLQQDGALTWEITRSNAPRDHTFQRTHTGARAPRPTFTPQRRSHSPLLRWWWRRGACGVVDNGRLGSMSSGAKCTPARDAPGRVAAHSDARLCPVCAPSVQGRGGSASRPQGARGQRLQTPRGEGAAPPDPKARGGSASRPQGARGQRLQTRRGGPVDRSSKH